MTINQPTRDIFAVLFYISKYIFFNIWKTNVQHNANLPAIFHLPPLFRKYHSSKTVKLWPEQYTVITSREEHLYRKTISQEDKIPGRQPPKKDYLNGIQAQRQNHTGRQSHRENTSQVDNCPHRKTTPEEDKLTGRQPDMNTTSKEDRQTNSK